MKKLNLINVVLIFVFSYNLFPQDPQWDTFHADVSGSYLGSEKEYVWVKSFNGVHRVNTITNEVQFFNKANSNISYNLIRNFALDSSGGVWLGTSNGLSYFIDGTFKSYKIDYGDPLPDNEIISLCVDLNETVWIGTDKGLVSFNGTDWISYNENKYPFANQRIKSLASDFSGNIWISVKDTGLIRFDGSKSFIFNDTNSIIRDNRVSDVLVGYDNTVFFIETHGWGDILFKISKDSTVQIVNDEFSLINNFGLDAEGDVYLGGYRENTDYMTLLKNDKWETIEINTGKDTAVNSFGYDHNNNLWAGLKHRKSQYTWSYTNGIFRVEGDKLIHYNLANSPLPGKFLRKIETDRSNNKWIMTNKGLVKINSAFEWKIFNSENSGLPSNDILSVAIDSTGNLWVGTKKGLAKMDGDGNWQVYNNSNTQMLSNSVYHLTVSPDNVLWVGFQHGFASFSNEVWSLYHKDTNGKYDFSNKIIRDFLSDLDGNIWIIAKNIPNTWSDTVFQYNDDVLNTLNSNDLDMVNQYNLTAIAVDLKSNIYIGNAYGEISKFDGEKWKKLFKIKDFYKNDFINFDIISLEVDNDGTIYFGTPRSNLWGCFYRYKGNYLRKYELDNSGICCASVWSVEVDAINNVWMCSGDEDFTGMSVFNENGPVLSAPEKKSIFDMDINLYPNPFADMINIEIFLPEPSETCIEIMNIEGETVKYFDEGILSKGSHVFNWDGTDNNGAKVPSGAYIVKVSTKYVQAAGKVMLVR